MMVTEKTTDNGCHGSQR